LVCIIQHMNLHRVTYKQHECVTSVLPVTVALPKMCYRVLHCTKIVHVLGDISGDGICKLLIYKDFLSVAQIMQYIW